MRNIVAVLILALYFLPSISHAQDLEKTDSIYRLLLITPGDTDLINSLNSSIDNLSYSHPDTALFYATQLDSLSIVAGYPHGSAMAMNLQGVCYELSGDIQKAIETYLQAERLSLEGRMKSLIRR